jgi:hypothetical protein
MTTLRAEFEALPEFVDDAALLQRQLDGQSYVYTRVQGMWEGWQAASERAAKLAADLAYDAAIKYANGREVDFEQEVAAAIRAAGGAG